MNLSNIERAVQCKEWNSSSSTSPHRSEEVHLVKNNPILGYFLPWHASSSSVGQLLGCSLGIGEGPGLQGPPKPRATHTFPAYGGSEKLSCPSQAGGWWPSWDLNPGFSYHAFHFRLLHPLGRHMCYMQGAVGAQNWRTPHAGDRTMVKDPVGVSAGSLLQREPCQALCLALRT